MFVISRPMFLHGRLEIPNIRPCSSVVEHSLGKGEVVRSIRIMGTSNYSIL